MLNSPSSRTAEGDHAHLPSKSPTKTQTADLHRVWTELCVRERQARIRNQQLLRDFAGLEAQLAALAAKTDALRRRKSDYEDFLQRLRRDLPRHQGAHRKQGLASDKHPELLAKPCSAGWDGQRPFKTEYWSEPLLFDPFYIASNHAPGAHGKLRPEFWEYKQGKAPLEHPFQSPTAHCAARHSSLSLPSPWSPQRLQKDKKPQLLHGQGRSHFASSQPWLVPVKTTALRRGFPLSEEWFGPTMTQAPEGQTIGSPMANGTLQGDETRRCSIPISGGPAEEQRDMPVRKEGRRLTRGPAGLSCHLRRHGYEPSNMDVPESQLGLPQMSSGANSSGSSVSSLAELNSGHWVAKRTTKVLPRQQRMKAKHQCTDTVIPNEEFTHMSCGRCPGQQENEEMGGIKGPKKVLKQEMQPCWEGPGDGELKGKGGNQRGRSVEEWGEATGSLDWGLEQTTEECRSLRERGAQEDEGLRGRLGGLEQQQRIGTEDQGGSEVGEIGIAGEGCVDTLQKDLEWVSVGKRGQPNLGSGSQESESVEEERNLECSDGEGGKSDAEVEGRSGERASTADKTEESRDGDSGDKEGGLDWAAGSQEGPSHLKENEDAASTSSGSDEIVMGPKVCVTSELQDNSGGCQDISLQNEGSLAAREDISHPNTESIFEEEEEDEEEEEEEESEADTDIEAALAPQSNKLETTREQQEETMIPDFQELQADSEEANKDGDLHDKDDFYD